jgi:ABC-type transport system involved in multi-copper enzyme maturation permease subunit
MTTATTPNAAYTGSWRADLGGTLRSEFTKICSVRSTYWALIMLVLAGLAFCVANCAGTAARWSSQPPQAMQFLDATQASIVGLALLGQLVIVVLGALAITSEYSTGMIRTSLSVMPRRGVLFTAKAASFAAITVVVAFATSFVTFFVGQALLASTHHNATLATPGAVRAVCCTALFIVVCALMAYGLGAILRSTPGAITAAYGLLFLLPQLAKALPNAWYADVVRWLPGGDALNALTRTVGPPAPHMFSAWGELAVFTGYAAILLTLGAVLLHRRDA